MLYVERHRAFAAVAAVFGPSSRAAASVTREMDDVSPHMHIHIQRMH